MCINDDKCCCWISLHTLGINSEGCVKDSKWLHSIQVSCTQSLMNQSVLMNVGNKNIQYIKTVAHGSFGSIDLATYEEILESGIKKKRDIYIKRPIFAGKSLLYEACIQKLVGEHLELIGFPTGAPKIVAIFKLLDGSVCFAMEQIESATTLSQLLGECSTENMTEIIIDCLLQVCAMIWYLESELGINHRDLKPSNFLVVSHTPEDKVLVIGNEMIEINSKYSITFIDFGFSCIGSTETNKMEVSLSSVYSKDDSCPKDGRDLYLFLAFLYMEFYSKFEKELLDIFNKWLELPGINMSIFLRKHGIKSKEWVYFYTGNPSVKEFKTCPNRIIKDLISINGR
jgi:serine/threonine protein kinase